MKLCKVSVLDTVLTRISESFCSFNFYSGNPNLFHSGSVSTLTWKEK